ncbi:molecular chaperone DnaJ [Paraoerskovia sediminicola]|uniref:Molecular chaperone DnaJ n=1 Tax=Paraoerskovia sediminicola TaxID=1138587 RepID=A0ABM8G323_9CELL|nr:DnaJ C-terminal domain-containing protein [Paraoerskovia sediminicola]BDZ42466.1 molecular chaperone DnaJ [Paraoerskovia sediminicola]
MTGQDWIEKDFYAALGVPKDADDATLKKSYRKLARQYHPDQNHGDPKAEERFKEIGEAYSVLSDREQRQQYDAIRQMAGGGARFAPGAGGAGGFDDLFGSMFGGSQQRARYQGAPGAGARGAPGGFEDLLGGMFGGGGGGFRPGGPAGFQANPTQRGQDVRANTTLPFRQAIEGSTVSLNVGGRTVTAKFPPGVHDGQKIRLRGKGRPGVNGGPSGDLEVTVRVTPHPVFRADGPNLRADLPVSFAEAALGATVEVPTFDGHTVRVKIPAGTSSGKVLRVKGRGIVTPKHTGDLLVTVQVAVPQKLSRQAKKAVEAFAEATEDKDVREEFARQAAQ